MNFVPWTLYFVLFLWAHGLTDLSAHYYGNSKAGSPLTGDDGSPLP